MSPEDASRMFWIKYGLPAGGVCLFHDRKTWATLRFHMGVYCTKCMSCLILPGYWTYANCCDTIGPKTYESDEITSEK